MIQKTPTGTWYVAQFQVTDAVGNILYVDRDELISRGFSDSFDVIGGVSDYEAPVLTGLGDYVPSSADLSVGPQAVAFDLSVDDASNIAQVYMWIQLDTPDGNAVQKKPITGLRSNLKMAVALAQTRMRMESSTRAARTN